MKKIILSLSLCAFMAAPVFVQAQDTTKTKTTKTTKKVKKDGKKMKSTTTTTDSTATGM